MADTEVPHADEDYIFISALNQYSYCPLRCYWRARSKIPANM
jgi:hypothetical protein